MNAYFDIHSNISQHRIDSALQHKHESLEQAAITAILEYAAEEGIESVTEAGARGYVKEYGIGYLDGWTIDEWANDLTEGYINADSPWARYATLDIGMLINDMLIGGELKLMAYDAAYGYHLILIERVWLYGAADDISRTLAVTEPAAA